VQEKSTSSKQMPVQQEDCVICNPAFENYMVNRPIKKEKSPSPKKHQHEMMSYFFEHMFCEIFHEEYVVSILLFYLSSAYACYVKTREALT
jgi:hypothetical protein